MEEKIEYIEYILLSCIEGNGLFDFYIYDIKTNKINLEELKKIFIYFIDRMILEIYEIDQLQKLETLEAKKLVEKNEIWENYELYNPLIITNPLGLEYYHKKIYKEEITNGIFPDFEIIESEKWIELEF